MTKQITDVEGDLVAKLESMGCKSEQLDELVHNEASRIGSIVNNGGIPNQVSFLLDGGVTPGEIMEAVKPDGPKSVCECGHTGDGPNSQHYDPVMPKGFEGVNQGHGHCTVEGCKCGTFTWKAHLPEVEAQLNPKD